MLHKCFPLIIPERKKSLITITLSLFSDSVVLQLKKMWVLDRNEQCGAYAIMCNENTVITRWIYQKYNYLQIFCESDIITVNIVSQ